MEKYNASRKDILALLKEAGGVSEQSVRDISQRTGIPEADIWGTGHFYELLSHPDIETRVCQGLTCQLAGASELEGQPVSCLGQCDRAPVAIGRDLHLSHFGRERGGVTPDNPELPMNLAGADSSDYAALHRARSMGTDAVIAELKASGLQGRGGAGFPAHFKWRAVADQAEPERYVICNADEGEPGTFKDCLLYTSPSPRDLSTSRMPSSA